MIRNDQELAVTRERVAKFEHLLEDLRKSARPEEWTELSSGYRLEIERMQRDILDYLVQAPPARSAPRQPDSVTLRSQPERVSHAPAQLCRLQHLDIRAELQELHQQLAVVRVRHLEQVAAVRVEARALLRVPVLRRHPAGRLGSEAQARPLHLAPGEDAVARAQVLVQLGGGISFARASLSSAARMASTAKLRRASRRWQ